MPANRLFLDANILIEVILEREKQNAAKKLLEKNGSNLYISALTAHLVTHFGQARVELPILRQFLSDYTMLALEPIDFEWAFVNMRDKDFEDALQLAVAIRNGCDEFLTFDKTLVEAYKDLPTIAVTLVSKL